MTRTRRSRGRRSRALTVPQIFTTEGLAPVTADTQVFQTIYNPPDSTSSLGTPTRFRLGPVRIYVTPGAAASRVYIVVRKVPEGYSAPTMTISSSVGSITDPMNVFGYAIIDGNNATIPTSLTMIKSTLTIQPGDTVVVQAVSDISSAGQKVDVIGSFFLSAA